MNRNIVIRIDLEGRGYDVVVGEDELDRVGEWIRTNTNLRGRYALITDTNVGRLYSERVSKSLEKSGFQGVKFEVPAGEGSKCLEMVGRCVDRMIESELDRTSFVVALGGGVVGDLAGFVAAVFYRGIPYVQIPTSVVAQVDSSVGGKTGVNSVLGKNLIGVFHQPSLVVADPKVLLTLADREYYEGFAEIVKHAILRAPDMLKKIKPSSREGLTELIAENIRIKAIIVQEDEKELSGKRALLNFGHTVGHAIEQAAGYGEWLHGEAVSMGMMVALRISRKVAGLSKEEELKIKSLLDILKLPTSLAKAPSTDKLMNAMRKDKKFKGGKVRFVLVRKIGDPYLSDEVTEKLVAETIEELRAI
ncbi:MAG: 3-dehydroquinate synthase [Chthoniobacterales bacterium]|nr:3-dehydroquinate synthase [Chthoniobacterales bacterium]